MTPKQRKLVQLERARLKAKYPETYDRDYGDVSDEHLLALELFKESVLNPSPGETVIGVFPALNGGPSRIIKTGPIQEGE